MESHVDTYVFEVCLVCLFRGCLPSLCLLAAYYQFSSRLPLPTPFTISIRFITFTKARDRDRDRDRDIVLFMFKFVVEGIL